MPFFRVKHLIALSVVGFLSVIPAGFQLAQAQDSGVMMLHIADNPNRQVKTVEAKIIIDAPPAMVWSVLTNYPAMKNILPGYRKSNVIRANGAGKVLDIAMKVSPILPVYNYQVQVRENRSHYRLNLQRISGDFKELDATYQLAPQNGGHQTVLSYQLNIDPGFNLPGSQRILKSNTEKSLEALEQHIEREARKKLVGQR